MNSFVFIFIFSIFFIFLYSIYAFPINKFASGVFLAFVISLFRITNQNLTTCLFMFIELFWCVLHICILTQLGPSYIFMMLLPTIKRIIATHFWSIGIVTNANLWLMLINAKVLLQVIYDHSKCLYYFIALKMFQIGNLSQNCLNCHFGI